MTSQPTSNSNQELEKNEEYSYKKDEINQPGLFEIFRLYLPTFPRNDIRTLIEIPFLLARKFAIGMENYLNNSLQLLTISDYEANHLTNQLKLSKYNKFIRIKGDYGNNQLLKGSFSKLKHNYILNNLKNHTGNIEIETFQNVPSCVRKYLIDNTEFYLEIQCCWFINLLSFWYFENLDICIRITENYCLNLTQLNDIFLNENELIHCETRNEVCRFILAELLVGIDFLHERYIIHRLLNPNHIYFDYRGHLKVGNIYESMNISRDIKQLYENWDLKSESKIGFINKLYKNYLDTEVLKYLLIDNLFKAYFEMDCLSDIFSIGIMITESLSGENLLSLSFWQRLYKPLLLNVYNVSYIVSVFHNPDLQMILRQQLANLCKSTSPEFYTLLLLILQPKITRMKGLRINVQRHDYCNRSGCQYKLRLSLVKKHPAFKGLQMNQLMLQSSPITRLLTILNSW